MKIVAVLVVVPCLTVFAAHAQDTSTNLQDATTQAAIAAQNLATATSNANAANANATAQQALLASQLANQKNEIANIQAALPAPNASTLRQTGTLVSPTLNATYSRLLVEQLEAWLTSGLPNTPAKSIADRSCDSVFVSRPSLTGLTLAYVGIDAKLYSSTVGLLSTSKTLNDMKIVTDKVAPTGPPTKKADNALLGTVAAVGAVANFALNVAAAAKVQTTLGSAQVTPASKIVSSMVAKSVPGTIPYYDPDLPFVSGFSKQPRGASCVAMKEDAIDALPVARKADCLNEAIAHAQAVVNDTTSRLPALDPASKADPNAGARTKLAALTSSIGQANADLQALFTTDKTTGTIPYVSAIQGELYSRKLDSRDPKSANACLLSLNTLSSDADSVVRDGTFSSYKLSLATTTTIAWQLAKPDGTILESGFKALTSPWSRQGLDDTH